MGGVRPAWLLAATIAVVVVGIALALIVYRAAGG